MAYVIQNLPIYTNALAGAIAGMGINQGNPTNPNPAFYLSMVQVAEAFAQSFDTRWQVLSIFTPDQFNVQAILATCKSYWSNRNAFGAVGTPGEFTTQTNFDPISNALIAMIQEAESLFPSPGPAPLPGSAGDPVLVFRPGATPNASNVFATEATLKAAWDTLQGPRWLEVDASNAACHFALAWDLGEATVTGKLLNSGAFSTLVWDQGATATFSKLVLDRVNFQNTSTLPVVTQVQRTFITMYQAEILSAVGAAEWLAIPNGGASFLSGFNSSQVGDATHAAISATGSGALGAFLFESSQINANALTGNGGFIVSLDASSSSSLTMPGATGTYNRSFVDNAAGVRFIAATAANWPGGLSPNFTNFGLDDLATNLLINSATPATMGSAPVENVNPGVAGGPGQTVPANPTTWLQVQLKGDAQVYWMPLFTVGGGGSLIGAMTPRHAPALTAEQAAELEKRK